MFAAIIPATMPEILEQRTKDILRQYLQDLKGLHNETAKRSRFHATLAELFPGSNAISDYARGVEKLIRIQQPTGIKRGRADAYYGNAIIEFENSLAATLSEAEVQLREYVAGTRLDYQKELTRQDFRQRFLVLYNHSGMNVAATYFDRGAEPIPFIVDVKLYWAAFATRQEAEYLAAILNSETVNQAIKPFQSAGLLGERDIHKKLLELPIPTFNHENKAHTDIAKLGAQAHEEAAKIVASGKFPSESAIARQRGFVRLNLKDTMKQIDKLVVNLLKGK